MEVTVYYKEGAPAGLLAETHEIPERPTRAVTCEEKWGSTTVEEGAPFERTTRLLMDGRGLVLAQASVCDPASEGSVPPPEEGASVVVVPAPMLGWVERVEADGAQVWPRVEEEPDELDAMAEKLGGIIGGL